MKRKMPLMKHVMTTFPYSIDIGAPLSEAREMMLEHNLRHLPVVENHDLTGIITERDVAVVFSLGSEMMTRPEFTVGSVCSRDPFTVDSNADVASVSLHMAENHIGCVVVTHNNKMAGIFTTTDACRFLGEHLQDLYGPPDGEPEAA